MDRQESIRPPDALESPGFTNEASGGTNELFQQRDRQSGTFPMSALLRIAPTVRTRQRASSCCRSMAFDPRSSAAADARKRRAFFGLSVFRAASRIATIRA